MRAKQITRQCSSLPKQQRNRRATDMPKGANKRGGLLPIGEAVEMTGAMGWRVWLEAVRAA